MFMTEGIKILQTSWALNNELIGTDSELLHTSLHMSASKFKLLILLLARCQARVALHFLSYTVAKTKQRSVLQRCSLPALNNLYTASQQDPNDTYHTIAAVLSTPASRWWLTADGGVCRLTARQRRKCTKQCTRDFCNVLIYMCQILFIKISSCSSWISLQIYVNSSLIS